MKSSIFLTLTLCCIGMLFSSCEPDTGIPYVHYHWDAFPIERMDYMPADGSKLLYVSEKEDSALFSFNIAYKDYTERPNVWDRIFSTMSEEYDCHGYFTLLWIHRNSQFTTNQQFILKSISVYMYDRSYLSFELFYTEKFLPAKLLITDVQGKRDRIFQYLTEEIYLHNYEGNITDVAMLAKGKGAVWFKEYYFENESDYRGTEITTWHLAEIWTPL